ncbi:retrovirus-related pol polyprotein from transposon TNT 1-94 [Tanacetum coccineum]
MLAPNPSSYYNGRASFVNPMYLKKAQSEKPCLYKVPYDKDDLANIFAPNCDETLILEEEILCLILINIPRWHANILDKIKECKHIEIEHSKQIENVSQEVYIALLRSFAKLEKHSIYLEIALQQCQEQLKNDKVWKQQEYTSFRELREKYFEIQDLKAQLQDRDIAISELKKLIKKSKGKSVETKFDKPTAIRQTNAIKVQKLSVMGKPTPFSDSLKKRDFSKPKLVTKTDVRKGLSNLSVTACNDNLMSKTLNVKAVCATCSKYVFNSDHDACVSKFLNDVNAKYKKPQVVLIRTRKPIRKVNQSLATPPKKIVSSDSTIQNSRSYYRMLYEKTNKAWKWWIKKQCPLGYQWIPKTKMKWVPNIRKENVNTSISPTIDNASRITNVLKLINSLGSNLSNVPSKSTCYIRDLQGNDRLTGTRGSDPYTISLQESSLPTPICFLAKASPTQAWLWHRRLSHLNFDTINLLSKNDIVKGLPKLKFVKDQMCSSCEIGKAKRSFLKSLTITRSKKRLDLLHMDLYGRMRIETINEKKYILVIVDNYSRYTWTLFLRSKNETPENGVVERRNRTLVEAARMMLSASKLPLFFWAEAIATACYTYNRYLIIPKHEKTPYHIINERKPTLKHLHIFGCTCYLVRDGENLDKIKEKGVTKLKTHDHNNEPSSSKLVPNVSSLADKTDTSLQELDFLFSPLLEEYFTAGNQSVSKLAALSDNSTQQDTQPTMNFQPTTEPTTRTTNVNAEENNTDQAVDAQFIRYEIFNPFYTPVQEVAEYSLRNVNNSNMHTFYQRYQSDYRWTKNHSLEQVHKNPSKPVQTRRQLATDTEMCMFVLIVSIAEPKNIKEAIDDHTWIKAMQEELHQFD